MKLVNPFNCVTLTGMIISELKIRTTNNNVPFLVEFTMSIERSEKRKKENGEWERVFDFALIRMRGEEDALFAVKYLRKNDNITLMGEYRSETYVKDNKKVVINFIQAYPPRWNPRRLPEQGTE